MVLWYIQFMLKWYYGIVVFNIFYYLCTQKTNHNNILYIWRTR